MSSEGKQQSKLNLLLIELDNEINRSRKVASELISSVCLIDEIREPRKETNEGKSEQPNTFVLMFQAKISELRRVNEVLEQVNNGLNSII